MSKTVIFGDSWTHIGGALAHQLHDDNGVPVHLAGRNKADLSALARRGEMRQHNLKI